MWKPAVLAGCAFVLLLAEARAAESNRQFLEGVDGFRVVIERLDPRITHFTIEELRMHVQVPLLAAGLPIGRESKRGRDQTPWLYLNITGYKYPPDSFRDFYIACITLTFYQYGIFPQGLAGFAATWDAGSLQASSSSDIRAKVRELVDQFAEDFLKANPKD